MLIEPKCYKNYIYILVYWILELFISIIKNLIYVTKTIDIGLINDLLNEYLQLVILVISDLLAGFLVIYTKSSFRKKNETKRKRAKGEIILIYKSPIDVNKKLKLLILISFLDFIARSPYFCYYLYKKVRILQRNQTDIIVAIDIFMRYFFSKIILKTKIYKHHRWAIIISIFGFLILFAIDLLGIIESEKDFCDKILFLVFLLPLAICYPLEDTYNKILLSDDFLLPHTLMFNRGLIEFVILVIFSLILYLTGNLQLEYTFGNDIILYILLKTGYTIISFVKAFCLMEIIYNFTSQYVSFLIVSESFAGTLNLLINFFIDRKKLPYIYSYDNNLPIILIIIELLSLCIITFGTLMYNEIIIINKCKLNEYTKKGLLDKEKKDLKTLHEDEDENENENENENNVSKTNTIEIEITVH